MLSYRHGFHAGNFADTLKHSVLSLMLEDLKKKDKPFSYLESHAGAGVYSLDEEWAQQTGEFQEGIQKLLDAPDAPAVLAPYLDYCKELWGAGHQYPGSPDLALHSARPQDNLVFMELHNTEIDQLRFNLRPWLQAHIHHRDGLEGLVALTPPEPRRGLALIDPSYEGGDDYTGVIDCLRRVHHRWSNGILALWYPLLPARMEEVQELKMQLSQSEFHSVLCAELSVRSLSGTLGMAGSGMLIIQPPWKLEEQIQAFLPWMCEKLAQDEGAGYTLEWLVQEENN